jgi:uncharacterized protein YdeI (YjbR/CyaY-like superfamily)
LQQEGLLHQSGINSVIASKESGLWNFMDDVDNLVIPEDLHHVLKEHKLASHYFAAFSPSNKRFILRYIKLAKTEQTRQKRILQVATLAAENKKIPGV